MKINLVGIARCAALVVVLTMPCLSSAATQGPDGGGYTATDATSYNFVDISGGGGGAGVLSGTDDGAVALTVPFSFTFYGTAYTNLCVSSNGAMYFVTDPNTCTQFNNGTLTDFQNTDLSAGPSPGDLPSIFPFWMDLDFSAPGAGSVYYQTIGTPGNRRFIVQWKSAFPSGDTQTVNFEVILAEGTNSITIQYATVNLGAGDPASIGASAVVAIRNTGGQTSSPPQQIQWSNDSAVLSDSYAILLQTSAAPGPPSLTFPLTGATGVAPPVSLTWNAGAGAISYDVYLDTVNPPVATIATSLSALTFTTGSLSAGTTYYWKVVAKNGTGPTPSPVASFSTPAPAGNGGNPGPVSTIITWSPPASIAYGTPLGPNQLNAAANAPGTFAYNPPAGTILNAGQQTLSASFSGGGSASVTLTVTQASQTITFAPVPNRTSDTLFLNISATASSGLPVVFSIVSGPATISGNGMSISGPGTIIVKASQPGNSNYLAATPVTQSVTIGVGNTVITGIVNSASYGNTPIASDAFSSLFGSSFANQPVSATSLPLPTSLGGATVTVTDSAGNSALAGLNYVSFTQINFVTPSGLLPGAAQITVTNANGKTYSFNGTIAPIAPAFFSADSSGSGVAVAALQTVNTDGSGGLTPAYTCAGSPVVCTPTPISFGSPGTKLYLTLYATGVRNRSTLAAVTATIGGIPVQVLFAGAQPTLAGLDQVNLVLDPSLAGKGVVPVQLTVDGVKLNPVTIAFK